MACPFFFPMAVAASHRQAARAPLGWIYQGRCEAGGEAGHDHCNFGYARNVCASFPQDAEVDAVRFTVLENKTLFVLERDHVPVRHGDPGILQGPMARQAEVFQTWAMK